MAAQNMSFVGMVNMNTGGQFASRGRNEREITLITTSNTSFRYKMRGYNTSTLQYEVWVTGNEDAPPPSGATLTNIAIVGIVPEAADRYSR